MKQKAPRSPRAALFIGAALLSTTAFAGSAFAQEVPAPEAVTPAPVQEAPAPAPAPAPVIQMAPSTPVVQTVPEAPAQPEATSTTTRTSARTTTRAAAPRQAAPVRQIVRSTATRTAPAVAAPAATSVGAIAPAAPAPVVEPAAQPAPAAETAAPAEAAPARTIPWAWVIGGLLVALAAAALLLARRRREEPEYVEETAYEPVTRTYEAPVAAPVYEEPVAPRAIETPVAAEPVIAPRHEPEVTPFMAATAAAPVLSNHEAEIGEAHVEAELSEPASEDLAGVTDAPAPVANRPWIEFGLRPVRAGTSDEEALVDVELTVGNAGDVPARDVRISTFMLADAEASEMDSLLTGRDADTAVPPVTIEPGDGTRVDAHLAVPKGEMGRVFNPVVVAEARYTLPDGREGRTSAAFKIGRPSEVADGVGPIGATRPHMVDNVEAELLGVPEHA